MYNNIARAFMLITFLPALAVYGSIGQPATSDQEVVVVRRELKGGGELLAIRSRIIDVSSFVSLMGTDSDRKILNIYLLRVEMRLPGQQSGAILWSDFYSQPSDDPTSEKNFLNVDIGHGKLVIAFFVGPALFLAHRDFASDELAAEPLECQIPGRDWSVYQAAMSLSRKIISLKWTESSEGLWSAEVIHRGPTEEQLTWFQQIKGKWQFKMIKSERRPLGK